MVEWGDQLEASFLNASFAPRGPLQRRKRASPFHHYVVARMKHGIYSKVRDVTRTPRIRRYSLSPYCLPSLSSSDSSQSSTDSSQSSSVSSPNLISSDYQGSYSVPKKLCKRHAPSTEGQVLNHKRPHYPSRKNNANNMRKSKRRKCEPKRFSFGEDEKKTRGLSSLRRGRPPKNFNSSTPASTLPKKKISFFFFFYITSITFNWSCYISSISWSFFFYTISSYGYNSYTWFFFTFFVTSIYTYNCT